MTFMSTTILNIHKCVTMSDILSLDTIGTINCRIRRATSDNKNRSKHNHDLEIEIVRMVR